MPLKHGLETGITALLGLAITFAGIGAALLPPLPSGAMYWAGAFVVSLIYGLLLYPMLRTHRADYPFRLLQFFPAAMLLIWLILQTGLLYEPRLAAMERLYIWGWTLPAVLLGFFLLAVFCLHVIRRRAQRLLLLSLILLPFGAAAILSEISGRSVWENRAEEEPSAVETSLERRDIRKERRLQEEQKKETPPANPDDIPTAPRLPSSGMETGWLAITLLAAYSAVLHRRARERTR